MSNTLQEVALGLTGTAVIGAAVGSGLLGTAAQSVLVQPLPRALIPASGPIIIPNVTIEESHHDELSITEHPVEIGATITDHSYKRPAELSMRCGWSNSSSGDLSETYVREIYNSLLELQESRQPCNVYTGKRQYQNMLVASVGVLNDARSEYALMVTLLLRQVILVATSSATVPPQSQQAIPASTQPDFSQGGKQLTPAPSQVNNPAIIQSLGTPPT